MNALPILIRREFWEHRMLWMAPVVLAGVYILLCLLPGPLNVAGIPRGMHVPSLSSEGSAVMLLSVQLVFTVFLVLLMGGVVFFYLADCLYAERKDRSILFWKSLPVSDWITVLSKVIVALVIMPIAIWALALVANAVAYGVLYARLHDTVIVPNFIRWDTGAWLRFNGQLFANILIISLWYVPIVGYQLLLSAWARNGVLVWTLLPPIALMLGEGWFLNSWHVAQFITYRLFSFGRTGQQIRGIDFGSGHHPTLGKFLNGTDLLPALGNIDLWLGVAVGVVLVLAAIRIRRYRDDS